MAGRTRENLLQTYKALDDAALLSSIVHDLRGPLTGIISAARLIDTLLSEDERVNLDQIAEINSLVHDAAQTLRTVLDAVADYDRERRAGVE